MENLLADVARFGGATTRRALYALGHSKRSLQSAVGCGSLIAPARSWVVRPDAHPSIAKALASHGRVAGSTALVTAGVWVTHEDSTWLAVKPGAHYAPLEPGTRRIECAFALDPAAPWRVSILDALAQHCSRASRNDAIASIDSALHKKRIVRSDLQKLARLLPERRRSWLKRVDGRAESGLESILRLACQDEGWSVDVQVPFRGGRLDLVINGWLCIEADGSATHDDEDQARKDRRRNTQLAAIGLRWHRFGYADVVYRLESCIRVIRTLLSQGDPRVHQPC